MSVPERLITASIAPLRGSVALLFHRSRIMRARTAPPSRPSSTRASSAPHGNVHGAAPYLFAPRKEWPLVDQGVGQARLTAEVDGVGIETAAHERRPRRQPILIDENTRNGLSDGIRAESHGSVQLETRSQTVRVYSVPAGQPPCDGDDGHGAGRAGPGCVVSPAKLMGKVVLKNSSANETLRASSGGSACY